jgi:ADP-heptose:LPS heptosyltransferase
VILALRALGIGDLATAVPALRGLRAAFPSDTLALAAPRSLAPLVDLVGGVDRLLPVDGVQSLPRGFASRLPRWWPAAGPRLAVNLHGRGPQSHRLLSAADPARLLAFACPAAGHLDGPHWRDEESEVDRWCRLLRWHGIPADPTDLALLPPGGRHPSGLSIIHPGAKAPERRWPAERFAAVARRLSATGHRVAITGSPAERDLADTVADLAGLPPTAVLAGRTGIGGLAGLVSGARLLVSGDTGIAHLATAYGIPSVVLFGPMDPAIWGPPPGRARHRAIWHGALAGQPSARAGAPVARGVHPALRAVTVAEVLHAVAEVLDVAAAETAGAAEPGRLARHAVAAQ